MRRLSCGALAAFALIADSPRAQVEEIVWDGAGRYSKTLPVAPGKFAELCGKLDKGRSVAWSFKSDAPLDFNIHFHEGERVSFPAKHDGMKRAQGRLDVTVEQDYCWMWTNKSRSAASVEIVLTTRR